MKLDCLDHPKLFEFASLLQVEELMAVGILESIFCVTARYAKRGDLGHLSNKAIALKIRWRGDADRLIRCLVDTRWLDKSPDPALRLIVHDWHDHCPNWVRGLLSKKGLLFASGASPSSRSKKAAPSSPLNLNHTLLPAETPSQIPPETPSQIGSQTNTPFENIIGPPSDDLPPGAEPHGDASAAMPDALWQALVDFKGSPTAVSSLAKTRAIQHADTYGIDAVVAMLRTLKTEGKPIGQLGLRLARDTKDEVNRGKPTGSDTADARRAAQRAREYPEADRDVPILKF